MIMHLKPSKIFTMVLATTEGSFLSFTQKQGKEKKKNTKKSQES